MLLRKLASRRYSYSLRNTTRCTCAQRNRAKISKVISLQDLAHLRDGAFDGLEPDEHARADMTMKRRNLIQVLLSQPVGSPFDFVIDYLADASVTLIANSCYSRNAIASSQAATGRPLQLTTMSRTTMPPRSSPSFAFPAYLHTPHARPLAGPAHAASAHERSNTFATTFHASRAILKRHRS